MGAQYFLGKQLLGESRHPPKWDEVSDSPCLHYMCGTCGEVWGTVTNTQQLDRWTFQMRLCGKHGNGSFIAAWANQFEELPPEVLRYELQLRLDTFERELENGNSSKS